MSQDSSVQRSPFHSNKHFSPAFMGEGLSTPAGRMQAIDQTPIQNVSQSIIVFESMQRMQENYGSGIEKFEFSNVKSVEKFSMDRIREDRDLIQFTLKTPEVQIEVEEVDSQISEDAGKGK